MKPIFLSLLLIIIVSRMPLTQSENSVYAVRNCDGESSAIEVDVSIGESNIVYAPPDGLQVSDIVTTNDQRLIFIGLSNDDSPAYLGTVRMIRLDTQDETQSTITYEPHPSDYDFAISNHSEELVFLADRSESTGFGLHLFDPQTDTVYYLTHAVIGGGYPQWSPDSQEIWFVDIDDSGWHITSIQVNDPETRIRRIDGEAVIYDFDIRDSDGQLALIGSQLLDIDPSFDNWSGINIYGQSGEIMLRTGIDAINVMYHGEDLYYIHRAYDYENEDFIYFVSRLDTTSGETELLFETECKLRW